MLLHFKSWIKSHGRHFIVRNSQDFKKVFFSRNHSNIKYGCSAHVVELSKKYIWNSFTGLQSSTLLKIKTPSRRLCVKNAKRRAFSELYFSVYGQNSITRLRSKREPFHTNNFVLAPSPRKKLTINNGITWLNGTSFSPCCHNWLACICFCACFAYYLGSFV